jgi:hypothetical protein
MFRSEFPHLQAINIGSYYVFTKMCTLIGSCIFYICKSLQIIAKGFIICNQIKFCFWRNPSVWGRQQVASPSWSCVFPILFLRRSPAAVFSVNCIRGVDYKNRWQRQMLLSSFVSRTVVCAGKWLYRTQKLCTSRPSGVQPTVTVSISSPEDGDSMFLRNVGIYRRVYTAPKPRTATSSNLVYDHLLIKMKF